MVKRKKIYAITSLLVCLLVQTVARAQPQATAIAQQLERFAAENLQEKLFVHTDKGFYAAGEIIWFKIYDADARFNHLLDLSKLAYVELLNQEHKPVLQAKIGLNHATGMGSFQLPYSISSGNYILRAYTNWMKNAGPDYFFEKNITVVNTLKKPDWPTVVKEGYDMQFFPEGGNLVNGINTTVAFRIVDAQGRSQEASGTVFNQRNEPVASFKTLRFGMGHFEIKPNSTDEYHAIVDIQGTKITGKLPAVMDKGFGLQVKSNAAGKINIHITANTGAQSVGLLIHTRQQLKKAMVKELLNGQADVLLDSSEIGEGISQITLFNEARQAVCERLVFKKPHALLLNIKADAAQYTTRKKVTLNIGSNDAAFIPQSANLSAAVYLLDTLQTPENADILSYLWLQSDLKGNIESPVYYFSETGEEAREAADNLMLTQGWRRFTWETVLQPVKHPPAFIPETEGHLISGKLVDRRNGQPVTGVPAYLSVPAERSLFNNSISTDNGNIVFNVKNFFGGNEIVVQTNPLTDSLYRVDIAPPFSDKFSTRLSPIFNYTEKDSAVLLQHSKTIQLGNSFYADRQQRFRYPAEMDTLPFYGAADNRYNLDDYTRFITMEEVMREYVADVRVRKNNNTFSCYVNDREYNNFFETAPLVLMDGVPVFNVTKMIEFDPLKIKSIEVVARKYYQNNMIHDGIIQYHSYNGDLAGYQLDANALVVEYEGLQLQREFYSPIYETAAQVQSRLPDLRNLLYWAPEIQTDEAGKKQISFYTGDESGKYIVVLQGISVGGLAGSAKLVFEVKK